MSPVDTGAGLTGTERGYGTGTGLTGTEPGYTGTGVTGTEIIFGMHLPQSGPAGVVLGSAWKGADAYFRSINDARDFRVYRPKEGEPAGAKDWRVLRKGVADLARRAEVRRRTSGTRRR